MKEANDRYLHFFERFHSHDRARKFAEELMAKAERNADEYTRQTGARHFGCCRR